MRSKIIHYCWFGPNKLPPLELSCVDSWKRFLPDYELRLWNERNFDFSSSRYAMQAYEVGKYAYVSDYVRTVVLYEYGGIYLDTDMEIRAGFRELIEKYDNVLGFLTSRQIGAGVISLCEHSPLMKSFMEYYNRDFIKNGVMNLCDNTGVLTELLRRQGLVMNRCTQKVNDIVVLSREYFYPKKISDNEFKITENTVAVHHASGSWMSERQRRRGSSFFWIKFCRPILCGIKRVLRAMIGQDGCRKIEIFVRDKLK